MDEPNDESEPRYLRWIPILVPFSAFVLVCGVYFIAAEVLQRHV
jgi:hypothetical protein